jgi:Protein kinase domain
MTERFELREQLGKGGMGVVWKARDNLTGEVIALKLLHTVYADDPDYLQRFEREVEVARRIESPNVVKTVGYGQRQGVPYMAMEYVDGQSLRELIRSRADAKAFTLNGGGFTPISAGRGLPWSEVKAIMLQVAKGLAAAHAAGVIHRDVKPSNILIAADGTVKLADFGVARALDLTRLTGTSTMLGTPVYMAPDASDDARSDLYSLGVVAYEALTGTPPFTGDSQQRVIMEHMRTMPDLERLPAESRKVVGWLLRKRAEERPRDAATLVAVLDGSTSMPRAAAGSRRRWLPPALVGVGVAGALAAALAVVALAVGGDDGTGRAASDEPSSAVREAPDSMGEVASWNGSVPSDAAGTTLDLGVREGDRVRIEATGEWCLGQQAADERVCYDAWGDAPAPWDTDLFHRTGRVGALIVRVGGEPWNAAGTDGSVEFVASGHGPLELRANDRESYYQDNYGSLSVRIAVFRAEVAGETPTSGSLIPTSPATPTSVPLLAVANSPSTLPAAPTPAPTARPTSAPTATQPSVQPTPASTPTATRTAVAITPTHTAVPASPTPVRPPTGRILAARVAPVANGMTFSVDYEYSGGGEVQFGVSLEDPNYVPGSDNRYVALVGVRTIGASSGTAQWTITCKDVLYHFQASSQKNAAVVRVVFTQVSFWDVVHYTAFNARAIFATQELSCPR